MRNLVLAWAALTACTPADDYPACDPFTPYQQCLDRFDVKGQNLPVYRNISISDPSVSVYQAVITIHGSSRDAAEDFHAMMATAAAAGTDEITAVIAPHFECAADDPPPDDLSWPCIDPVDWAHGEPDVTGSISSYAAMDQLVAWLGNKQMFPYLSRIVITGMGAGGQFVDRYAATTGVDPIANTAISYAPVAPASYMWLDANRSGSFTGSGDCSLFDAYPYGLDGRTGYVATPDVATVLDRLTTRDVTYFVGTEDTLANSTGTDMDTSCEANAQGVDRLTRAINFHNSIALDGATQPLTTVSGCDHSRSCMYGSYPVVSTIFPPVEQ